jgi:hypothetical protein
MKTHAQAVVIGGGVVGAGVVGAGVLKARRRAAAAFDSSGKLMRT